MPHAKPFKFKKYETDGKPKFKKDNGNPADPDISIDDLETLLISQGDTLEGCFQDDWTIYDDDKDHSTWVCVRGRCWKVG